jgi:hypothetical protein
MLQSLTKSLTKSLRQKSETLDRFTAEGYARCRQRIMAD